MKHIDDVTAERCSIKAMMVQNFVLLPRIWIIINFETIKLGPNMLLVISIWALSMWRYGLYVSSWTISRSVVGSYIDFVHAVLFHDDVMAFLFFGIFLSLLVGIANSRVLFQSVPKSFSVVIGRVRSSAVWSLASTWRSTQKLTLDEWARRRVRNLRKLWC